jgi:hypothetical protein
LAQRSPAQKEKIVESYSYIPLVIEWFVGRCKSRESVVREADQLLAAGRHEEELLEFAFRRVYDDFNDWVKLILKTICLIGRLLPLEAIAAGAGVDAVHVVADDIDELEESSLVEKQYDNSYRDITYSLLAVTETFVYREVRRDGGAEQAIRKRLKKWYEAREIVDPDQRELVQRVRRSERNPELALLEVAKNYVGSGNLEKAEEYFHKGLERNNRSW